MHGVDSHKGVADDQANGIGSTEIVHVPVWVIGVGSVALVGEEEKRVVVVGTEGGAVDEPEVVAGSVLSYGDFDCLDSSGDRVDGFGAERDGLGERVVGTNGGVVRSGRRVGCLASISFFVVDCRESVCLSWKRAWKFWDVGSHEHGIGGFAVGGDQNIGPLSHSERDYVGLVWLDGHKVVRNHGHGMIVNGKLLNAFTSGIDQSKTMGLAGLKPEFRDACIRSACSTGRDLGAVIVHFAVDKVVVGNFWGFWGYSGYSLDLFYDLEVLLMIVISEQDRSNVDIVGCVFWPIDDHSSKCTGDVLRAVVSMPQAGAEEVCFEFIREGRARSDWALLIARL